MMAHKMNLLAVALLLSISPAIGWSAMEVRIRTPIAANTTIPRDTVVTVSGRADPPDSGANQSAGKTNF